MRSIKSVIEITTNLVLLVVTCLILWLFFTHRDLFLHKSAQASDVSILKGKVLAAPYGYDWKKYDETLVLALRYGCRFCRQSMPFYQRLSQMEKDKQLHAHLLVVMPDSKDTVGAELKIAGINADSIFGQPLSSISVSGTPTLLLVDSAGRVEDAWVGQLQPQQEQEVIEKLKQ
ncbi:MAG: hypothetical protein IRZ03_16480 [Acidobacterium ailaaui]|nr:hypothetical protein [Pseudacidobacterium ailaaui]